jgi:hypothetical protein
MLKEKLKQMLPTGTVMRKDDYWPLVNKAGGSPDLYKQGVDTCAFISVHKAIFDNQWSLLSPLFLVKDSGERPSFEQERYTDFAACLMVAIQSALENDTFVVICDDPISGKTMQPSRDYPQV